MAISRSETAEAVGALLEPVQQRYQALRADEAHLLSVLSLGADRARAPAPRRRCRRSMPPWDLSPKV
jgi:hypothetical protein